MFTSKNDPARERKKRSRIPTGVVFSNPWCLIGYGFGSGLAPVAPGTFGTLSAIPLYLLLSHLAPEQYGLLLFGMFLIGVHACSICERVSAMEDDSGIVWDEVVGFLMTMAFFKATFASVALGFVYFRFFDILKPWPIRILDRRVHGGFGVMIDDLIAGLFAAAALWMTQTAFALSSITLR